MTASLNARDGVNTDAGDSLGKIAARLCASTYDACPYVEVTDNSAGLFRGPRSWIWKGLPRNVGFATASDGVGTKVVIHDALYRHRDAGKDLIAMTSMDIARYGGLACVMSNVLDLRTIGDHAYLVTDLYTGLAQAARDAGIVLMNGETAELGPLVGSDNADASLMFNWSGFMVGITRPNRIINGKKLCPKQPIIALREHGFRSNGISSVRKAFAQQYGEGWYTNANARPYLAQAGKPSVSYDRLLARVNGWMDDKAMEVALIAHITGGGIRDKFFNDHLKPRGLSAVLDNLYEPPAIMHMCAKWRGIEDDRELYGTWNGGQGMLVVLRHQQDIPRILAYAREVGIDAQECGSILHTPNGQCPRLSIRSAFSGKMFDYT